MMDAVLLELLHRLEIIQEEHDGLGETEVRLTMGNTIFDGFFKSVRGFALPDKFGMDSEEADELVRAALEWFIPAANQACQHAGLVTFQARLNAFQNLNVRTESGNDYHAFFATYCSDCYDEDGNLNGVARLSPS